MSQKKFTRSFAGGIIAPELFGRIDLTKNQTGLKDALNFEILPHGPAANRAGFEYVLNAKFNNKACYLFPFQFNTQQTYILEVGDLYIRFFTSGGSVLEAAQNITGITAANPGVVTIPAHGFTNGQWVYITGIVTGPTLLNGRYAIVAGAAANTFQLTDLNGTAIDTSAMPAWVAGGTCSRVYEIATPYVAADVVDLHYVQNQDTLTFVHPSYQQRELKRLGAASWTLTTFTLVPVQAAPTALNVTPSGAGAESNSYVVTGVAADGQEESLASTSGTGVGVVLATAGAFNTVKWTDATGTVRYNVYKLRSGLYGYIGQALNGTVGFKDDNIFPDMTRTPPEGTDPFVGANNFPGAVSYHEQRRCFAGTNTKPQNFWATKSGTEKNLTYSIPSRDSDSLSFRIAARQVNRIRHIVPLQDLLLMTSGGIFRVIAVGAGALTPTSIDVKIQSNIGVANVQPVIADFAVLYVQAQGGHIYEMRLSVNQAYQSVYTPEDASLMCPQLFDGYTITQMAWCQAPRPQAWAVRSDGILLGLTYLPKHDVVAWHQHNTNNGTFESCAAVTEGTEDSLYVVTNRTLNGRQLRLIERKRSRTFVAPADAFFVDCGLTYSGTPVSIIVGLYHLEGMVVSALGDGVVNPPVTVVNGQITLQAPASKIHIGLPITADLQTLPLAMEQAQAFGQGTQKNIDKAYLRLYRSSSVFVGPDFNNLRQLKQRTTEPYGSPPALLTGEYPVTLTGAWSSDGTVCLRQVDPLPLTLVALTTDVAMGG